MESFYPESRNRTVDESQHGASSGRPTQVLLWVPGTKDPLCGMVLTQRSAGSNAVEQSNFGARIVSWTRTRKEFVYCETSLVLRLVLQLAEPMTDDQL
eukprot:2770886-Amphidinium_carterae.1